MIPSDYLMAVVANALPANDVDVEALEDAGYLHHPPRQRARRSRRRTLNAGGRGMTTAGHWEQPSRHVSYDWQSPVQENAQLPPVATALRAQSKQPCVLMPCPPPSTQ